MKNVACDAFILCFHDGDFKEAFTPLTVAVREDHMEMAEFLLKEGANLNVTDQDQRSAQSSSLLKVLNCLCYVVLCCDSLQFPVMHCVTFLYDDTLRHITLRYF